MQGVGEPNPPFLSLPLGGASRHAYALRAAAIFPVSPLLTHQSLRGRRLCSQAHPFFRTIAGVDLIPLSLISF